MSYRLKREPFQDIICGQQQCLPMDKKLLGFALVTRRPVSVWAGTAKPYSTLVGVTSEMEIAEYSR